MIRKEQNSLNQFSNPFKGEKAINVNLENGFLWCKIGSKVNVIKIITVLETNTIKKCKKKLKAT